MNLWQFVLSVGEWMDETAGECDPCSWVFHAVVGIPAALLFGPLTPFAIFLYREVEQVFFKLQNGEELNPLDHVMDVAVPGVVGIVAWWVQYLYF